MISLTFTTICMCYSLFFLEGSVAQNLPPLKKQFPPRAAQNWCLSRTFRGDQVVDKSRPVWEFSPSR